MADYIVQAGWSGLYHLQLDDGSFRTLCGRKLSNPDPWWPGQPEPKPERYCLLCNKRGDFSAARKERIQKEESAKAEKRTEFAARVARYGQVNVARDYALHMARRGLSRVGFVEENGRVSEVVVLREDVKNPQLLTGLICEVDGIRFALRVTKVGLGQTAATELPPGGRDGQFTASS